jgi:hypothetical protein
MQEPPVGRQELGFRRTECACELCQAYCRHLPGTLTPSDLARLCPPGCDLFAWAEQHLRALTDKRYPALVPARRGDGPCHWYFDGRCAVHAAAPFGCAFFDSHMAEAEGDRRAAAAVRAIRDDASAAGPYYRVWLHLRRKGLIGRPGDRSALGRELQQIRRRAEGSRRRLQGNRALGGEYL